MRSPLKTCRLRRREIIVTRRQANRAKSRQNRRRLRSAGAGCARAGELC
jgi:hypothetical protein